MKFKDLRAFEQIVCYDATSVNAGLLRYSSRKGSYLLKDGHPSIKTVYNQEIGIFIDENLYIPLKMSKQLFTAREAKVYYRTLGEKMPDLYQVIRFKLAVKVFNASLKKIGMQEYVFPEDILHNVWYEEALEDAKPGDTRRCVVISGYEGYQEPAYQLINNDCLLFADTILYRRTEECYKPVSPILKFRWSGLDFINAKIEGLEYIFYRGQDHKLVYLDAFVITRPINHELMVIFSRCSPDFGDLYQSFGGKLHKICSFDPQTSFSRLNDIEILVSRSKWLGGADQNEEMHFQKDENGLFVKVN